MLLSTGCCVGDGCRGVLGVVLRRMLLGTGHCVAHGTAAGGRRAGGRAAGGRADRDFNRTPQDSLLQRDAVEHWVLRWKRMLLSARRCVSQRDADEYWELRWLQMPLSTRRCVGRRTLLSTGCRAEHGSAGGRAGGGGRRAGRDFNGTPNDSLLQRDAVEHWVLRWRRMPLSTGCCARADAAGHWALRCARNRGGRRAGGRAAAGGGRVGILIELLTIPSCSGMPLSTGCCAGGGCR